MPRTLTELLDSEQAGMAVVTTLLGHATRPVERLDCTSAAGDMTLLALQRDTREALGALAHGTGGLLVDHGWLRVLGGGSDRLPRSLASWNQIGEGAGRLPGALLVADDVLGGFFAINQGGLLGSPGEVCWLSPQTLDWASLDIGYEGFLESALLGTLNERYAPWRWPGWEEMVKALPTSQCFELDPPAAVPGKPFAERSRSARTVDALWTQHTDTLPRLLRAPEVK